MGDTKGKKITHTIYFKSEESKKDFLDFAYSEDFTKAWDEFDRKKEEKANAEKTTTD